MDVNSRLQLGTTIACLVTVGGLLLLNFWQWKRNSRRPVQDRLLRAPGESLREKVVRLNEYLAYSYALAWVVPMFAVWTLKDPVRLSTLLLVVVLALLSALPLFWLIRLVRLYKIWPGAASERWAKN